jgi:hypothetical protein
MRSKEHGAAYGMFRMSACGQPEGAFNPESECEKCKGQLDIDINITGDNYYRCAIKSAIFPDALRRRNNAYVAHNIVKFAVFHIPLSFMKRVIKQVGAKGQLPEIAEP